MIGSARSFRDRRTQTPLVCSETGKLIIKLACQLLVRDKRDMHVIYLTCPICDHTGMTRDPKAIEAHKRVRRYRVKCSSCGASGASDQFRPSLSFYKDVNPYRQSERVG